MFMSGELDTATTAGNQKLSLLVKIYKKSRLAKIEYSPCLKVVCCTPSLERKPINKKGQSQKNPPGFLFYLAHHQ